MSAGQIDPRMKAPRNLHARVQKTEMESGLYKNISAHFFGLLCKISHAGYGMWHDTLLPIFCLGLFMSRTNIRCSSSSRSAQQVRMISSWRALLIRQSTYSTRR